MEISISSNRTSLKIDHQKLARKASQVLEGLGCSPSSILSVAFVDSEAMAALNMKYRGKEGPTNVLSFSQKDGDSAGTQPDLLGDVVICAERAVDDALRLGYSVEEMVVYLLIHGILHLVGYDHSRPEDAATMHEKVEQVFHELYPTEIPS